MNLCSSSREAIFSYFLDKKLKASLPAQTAGAVSVTAVSSVGEEPLILLCGEETRQKEQIYYQTYRFAISISSVMCILDLKLSSKLRRTS